MIGLIGLNHKSAPVAIRGQFVFNNEEIIEFGKSMHEIGFKGIVVLSTCNRTEIYFEVVGESDTAYDLLISNLLLFKNANSGSAEYFYRFNQEKTIRHIFKVVCGLDSLALGEYQIVCQVKDAFKVVYDSQLIGSTLIRLFNKALGTGKRVRTETEINKGANSVSYAGVEMASQQFNELCNKKILLVGAGETSELTLHNFHKKGCNNITITNRTFTKAEHLAVKYNGKVIEINELAEQLHNFDIIVTSTASEKPLITAEMTAKAMQTRNGKKQVYIDLSVPRNVAVEVESLENVYVFDVDSLANETVDEFLTWVNERNLSEVIAAINKNFRRINSTEIQGFKKNESVNDYTKAEEYGDHITEKFIRLLIKKTKDVTDNGKRKEYINLVNELFELN